MSEIEEMIVRLPVEIRGEVRDFIEFLLQKRGITGRRRLKLSWAGALRDLRDRYTSLDLQRKALEWRGD